jgi:hypothetical protein
MYVATTHKTHTIVHVFWHWLHYASWNVHTMATTESDQLIKRKLSIAPCLPRVRVLAPLVFKSTALAAIESIDNKVLQLLCLLQSFAQLLLRHFVVHSLAAAAPSSAAALESTVR